jgi:hypothetical protein
MRRAARILAAALCLAAPHVATAGMLVKVQDPRYFDTAHPVIFPNAEVKLVSFEFESVRDDERGKLRARQLHDEFLRRIQSLPGGAVVTYVTPPGQKIASYRETAERVAKEQRAQLAVWGRIWASDDGRVLFAARLALIQPPPGVSARYEVESGGGGVYQGVIDAPVTGTRIDFAPVEDDVGPLAAFLEGIARYYKGSARSGPEAVRWLQESVRAFEEYLRKAEGKDPSASAQAHLYAARSLLRLANDAPAARRKEHLAAAAGHAAQAAQLNPYDAQVPPLLAIVAQRSGSPPAAVREHLARAVQLAPADATARLNLAMADAASGRKADALRGAETAAQIERLDGKGEKRAASLKLGIERGHQ